jgi:hypothetical protein
LSSYRGQGKILGLNAQGVLVGNQDCRERKIMSKLFAVVAVAALALTVAVPAVQAAPSTAQIHKTGHSNVHKVATKKTTKAKTKSVKKKAASNHAASTPKA